MTRFLLSMGSEMSLTEPGKCEYNVHLYELDADGDPVNLPIAAATGQIWGQVINDGDNVLHKTAVFMRLICRDIEDQFLEAVRSGNIGVPADISTRE